MDWGPGGSVAGTRPGLDLLGVHIPLNPDPYTDATGVDGERAGGAKLVFRQPTLHTSSVRLRVLPRDLLIRSGGVGGRVDQTRWHSGGRKAVPGMTAIRIVGPHHGR